MKKRTIYFLILLAIFVMIFFAYAEKSFTESKKTHPQDSSYSDGESSFIQAVEQKPYRSEWQSPVLLQKMFAILEDPSLDIVPAFSGTLTKSPDEQEYYLGAYTLSDGVDCKLLWLSNTTSFSIGATFFGDADSIAGMERFLKSKLDSPSQEESENNTSDFYWIGKKYRQKDYTITVKKTTDVVNHMITLDITMHPQIYH